MARAALLLLGIAVVNLVGVLVLGVGLLVAGAVLAVLGIERRR